MKKIKYIIRKRALGDVLWIEPVIRSLSQQYEQLIVYTKYNELFDNYPLRNVKFKRRLSFFEKCLITAEKILNTHFFTINLDGAYEKHPLIHFLNAYQLESGLPETREYPKIYLSEDERNDRKIEGHYIVLHLESFSDRNYRQIYGISWDEVIAYLKNKGLTVVQIGLKGVKLNGTVKVNTSLRELISLINGCKLFIGIDSGPSHIAASLGVNTMIFFGAINPLLRHFPEQMKGTIMKLPCESFNCHHGGFDTASLNCQILTNEGVPRCCVFKTGDVILKIEEQLQKNATEIYK